MSKHYSWKRLYEAVKTGNLVETEEALFYLDAKVYENALVHGANALTLAANYGHVDILRLLLDHCIYGYENNAKDPKTASIIRRANYTFFDIIVQKGDSVQKGNSIIASFSDQIGLALQAAAKSQQSAVIDVLLLYGPLIEEKYWLGALSWAARNNDFSLINVLIKESATSPVVNREKTYTVLLQTLYAMGNNQLENLDQEICGHPEFRECLATFHPLHRSIFTCDRTYLKRLLKKYPYWYKIDFPESECEWSSRKNVFQVAANIGDLRCLEFLHKEASFLLGFDELRSIMTNVCVEVCEVGRWEVVSHSIRRGWIERQYIEVPQWSPKQKQEVMTRPFWGKMMNTALWTGRTALALELMEKHFSRKNKDNVPSSHDLSEELQLYQHFEFCDSDWRNDVGVQKKIHKHLKSLSANEALPTPPWEGEFLHCIRGGFPDSVNFYLPTFSETQIQQMMDHMWYSLAQGTRMSIVSLEYLRDHNIHGIDKLLQSNVRWGSNERTLDCFVEVVRQLLLDEKCGCRVDFRTLPDILKTWMVNCQTERCWRDVIHLFDFFDAAEMWSSIFTFTELGHAFDLNNICRLFTIVCGTKLKRVIWPGLYAEAMLLCKSDRDALRQFIFNSGVRILDSEFERGKALSNSKLLESSNKSESYDKIFTQVSELGAIPDASKMTLSAHCRIVVRRTIRLNAPKVSSLTDRILSLAVDGTLPRRVVAYLLFRPELTKLPPRTCMIKQRMSHARRFYFSWEEEEYMFRTIPESERQPQPHRRQRHRERRPQFGNFARVRNH